MSFKVTESPTGGNAVRSVDVVRVPKAELNAQYDRNVAAGGDGGPTGTSPSLESGGGEGYNGNQPERFVDDWNGADPEGGPGAEGAGETFSPINPGTLSDEVASTFRSSTYTKRVLTEDTVFYRVYGGNAKIAGNYMSRTPQMGGLQSQLDLALVPEWGNTATYVTKVTVPKGTVIYEGFAAPQTINGGAGMIMGGGSQIFIPEARLNPSWFGK